MVAITYGAARAAAKSEFFAKIRGFFGRVMAALIEARMQQARRELALHSYMIPSEWYADKSPKGGW